MSAIRSSAQKTWLAIGLCLAVSAAAAAIAVYMVRDCTCGVHEDWRGPFDILVGSVIVGEFEILIPLALLALAGGLLVWSMLQSGQRTSALPRLAKVTAGAGVLAALFFALAGGAHMIHAVETGVARDYLVFRSNYVWIGVSTTLGFLAAATALLALLIHRRRIG